MTTREEIYLAIALAVTFGALVEVFKPALKWAANKSFAWILSLSSTIESAFYRKVARRDTSVASMIHYGVNTILPWVLLQSLPKVPYLSLAFATLGILSSVSFCVASIRLTFAERFIRRYDHLRATVRPTVDEVYLMVLDSRFASMDTKLEYDKVIEDLRNGYKESPRRLT